MTLCEKFCRLKSFRKRTLRLACWLPFALMAYGGLSQAATISGRVSLPVSDVAPVGGLRIFYQAADLQASNPAPSQSTFLDILEGASFRDFILTVPDNATAQWRVSASCSWSLRPGCRNYVQTGYYFDDNGSPGTSYKLSDAETVSENATGVNITILEGTGFSGSLTMPAGTAGADFEYQIFVTTPDITSYSNNAIFTIASGTNTGTFHVTAPNDAALKYNIRYQCQSGFCTDNYVVNGFYDSSLPDNTTENNGDADDLSGNVSTTGIDMTFLTGATISGTIFLPTGTATDDISVDILANDVSNSNLPARTTVLFSSGDASKIYTINAANDVNADWRISYFCNSLLTPASCANYFEQAYYDADDLVDTTTDNLNDADTLAGALDHTLINLTLLAAASISGTVALDAGMLAPANGLDISVGAQLPGGGLNEFDNIHIVAGTNSSNYTIVVPDAPANTWRVSYFCRAPGSLDACLDYTTNGFYDAGATGTTTFDISEADGLSGSSSYSSIDLTLFELKDDSVSCFPVKSSNSVSIICL